MKYNSLFIISLLLLSSCKFSPKFLQCDECDGDREIVVDCEGCDGVGFVECERCNSYGKLRCEQCEGEGKVKKECPECKGSGKKYL